MKTKRKEIKREPQDIHILILIDMDFIIITINMSKKIDEKMDNFTKELESIKMSNGENIIAEIKYTTDGLTAD